MDPLLSVCVPLFNKATAIESSLRSVMAFDADPIEILVFDNGSSDGSSDAVRRLAAEDTRIRHVRIEHTLMIQESWRMAILHGRGDLLKVQSGDDVIDPAFLPEMLDPLKDNPDLDYTLCGEMASGPGAPGFDMAATQNSYRKTNENCRKIIGMAALRDRARQIVASSAVFNALGNIYKMVCRRRVLPVARWKLTTSAYPMPTSYPDWDFLVRLLLNCRGTYVDRELSHYLITQDSPLMRIAGNATMQIADGHQHLLQMLAVLTDPTLAELRAALQPQEIRQLAGIALKRTEALINLGLSVPPPKP